MVRDDSSIRRPWLWNEEIKEKFKKQREAYATMRDSISEKERVANRKKYKITNNEAKEVVKQVKNIAYERIYERLEMKDGEKDILSF